MNKKFVLIGAAGYVAPKHMKAIKDVGGNLIACLDPHDSIGVIDSYFKDCKYFREYERFDRFCIKNYVDYCVVCSPNYFHDAHCLFGLRIGADVICEKPLVLNTRNIDQLQLAEEEYGGRIWNILQLRLSPLLDQMKKYITENNKVKVIYYTPRGDWYEYSWKGNIRKSGGIFTNIGVHLLDLLLYLFSNDWNVINHTYNSRNGNVHLSIRNTEVLIDLSIEKDKSPTRTFIINDYNFDLSENFGDLHTKSYEEILNGNGFGIEEVRPVIKLCEYLR